MEDKYQMINTKVAELVQTIVEISDGKKNEDHMQLAQMLSQLLNKLDRIEKQNEEILKQNNLILDNQNKTAFYSDERTFEENNQPKEFNQTPFYSDKTEIPAEQKVKEEIDVIQETVEEIKPEIEIKEPIQETKPENTEQPAQTSSVLEFLHKRVIKDSAKQDGNQPLTISNITEQIVTGPKRDFVPGNTTVDKTEATKKPTSIADKFENRNQANLLTAIGINEKCMFINDLFFGNTKEYNEFIGQVNSCTDLGSALNELALMQNQRKWAKGSLAYTTLENLINKRFE